MILLVRDGEGVRPASRPGLRQASVHPVSNSANMGGEIGGELRMDSRGGTLCGEGRTRG